MSRFFGSKKRRNKYITTAKEYYEDHYDGEESEVPSDEEEEIIEKITSLGAIRVKKTSSYMTQYEFDLPAEHEDDVYHRIFLSIEGNQEVNIDADLNETFPIFLHAMVRQEYKGKVFESFEGLSVSNFLTLRTNNEKLARKILDTPKVSMAYMAILDDIKLLSINSSTLSAKLSGLDKLEGFFHFMTQLIKVAF